jgi:hypothetical protein
VHSEVGVGFRAAPRNVVLLRLDLGGSAVCVD